jgi:AcrR family transcriptional regulator
MKSSAKSSGERSKSKSARKRLQPFDRERLIVEAAVRFFAENGFEGQTRKLAASLGITQPLLYRYFPSKEALIERVYQEVFIGRWNPDWEAWLERHGATCGRPPEPLLQRLRPHSPGSGLFQTLHFVRAKGTGLQHPAHREPPQADLPARCRNPPAGIQDAFVRGSPRHGNGN